MRWPPRYSKLSLRGNFLALSRAGRHRLPECEMMDHHWHHSHRLTISCVFEISFLAEELGQFLAEAGFNSLRLSHRWIKLTTSGSVSHLMDSFAL
jgi:hypothetical protein